ncbi:MAG: ABC transporter permease, partial [Clostridia bacterium]
SAFFRYVGGLFRGELGASYLETGVSANSLIKTRLPWTLFISTCALAISFVLGTLLGGVVAQKRNSVTDKIVSSYVAVSGS